MLILGIDPGSRICGFGLVKHERHSLKYVDSGRFTLMTTPPLAERLARLQGFLVELVHRHAPDTGVVEKVFFAKSVQSALSLGHARGVCLLVAARRGLDVVEYPPSVVKKALTGNGGAGKQQVAYMVAHVLGVEAESSDHASDALAAAICLLQASEPLRLFE